MAKGLLGDGNLGPGANSTITVYTVPAGISHAVVHITLSPTGMRDDTIDLTVSARVNGVPILSPGTSGTSTGLIYSASATSMMLSPGDVVTLQGNNTIVLGWGCTVSGYEVP
jgi:hypothetical protein